MDSGASRPLRLGLVLDGWQQPAWVHRLVSRLQDSDHARIVLVAVPDVERPRVRTQPAFWLYRAYLELDKHLFQHRPDPFALSDLAPLVEPCTLVKLERPGGDEDREFPDSALRALRSQDPDLLLCLGGCRPGAPLMARHGVWACHPDSSLTNDGIWGFWEVMEDAPTTGVLITRLDDNGSDTETIHRSDAPTCWYSVHRNRANAAWKTADLLEHKLRQLAAGLAPSAPVLPAPDRPAAPPTNAPMSRLLGRLAVRLARSILERTFYRRQWCIAWIPHGAPGQIDSSFGDYRYLIPPQDRQWADPFPLRVDERTCLFFEEYDSSHRRGRIMATELGPDGDWKPPVEVLSVAPHLSYPFVFEWRGRLRMIPDTARRQVVELYRCHSFPDRWELEATLLEGVRAVDSSVVEWNGCWWLFAAIAPEGSRPVDELHVYRATTPLGPWTPHALNPVKSDVRSARPAGRPFVHEGALYRPSQDCSSNSGRAIIINNVVELDEGRFREAEVARLEPDWSDDVMGIHTLNVIDGLSVIDCRLRRPRWR